MCDDPKHTGRSETRAGAGDGEARSAVERKSPPTERVVQILNLLADTPREQLTLTQVASSLGLNKPTCLGILTALTDAHFVTRDESKSYGLGPALLRLGAAAESGLANLDLVRPVLAELHDRVGVSCVLSTTHQGQIVIVDRLGTVIPGDRQDLIAERYSLTPPLGLVNIAWEHDDVVDAWLNRSPLIPLGAGKDKVRTIIDNGRERGYLIQRLTTTTSSNIVLASLLTSEMPRRVIDEVLRYLPPADWSEFIGDLPDDDGADIPVATISTPIHDRRGAQQYTLTLVPGRPDATVGECKEWAKSAVNAARTATIALGGS
ncbi:IclR family transcriptional regulator [Nocardia australiensis]|uniref:IclR family transcriptional regulator n=1 Tax=Nocardia australiensis TaxID=2887191 RepID=UPI001D14CBE6|nr:helix-turn-helix domain-containing protein [Nocardia australiensis]